MPSEHQTKTCHVTKESSESYEFFLKNSSERKGQIITSVGSNGPAKRAGLKDGDRIVEINGKNVENKDHDQIVQLIKESMPKNEITLEVVEESVDSNSLTTRTNGSVKGKEGKTPLAPRLILLKKKNNTFGFQLENRGKDKPGHFVVAITEGGAAQIAGLKEHDRIIEINGDRVEKLNHKKVVGLMIQSGDQVKLLVVDEATYKHFTARKIKIKAKHASSSGKEVQNKSVKSSTKQSQKQEKSGVKSSSVAPSSDDANARLVHVVKSSNSGFGFFLRMKKDEKGEFLGNVEPSKPAGRCGLMENDLILSVNKKGILSKPHDDVVEIIKSNSNHAVFLVIGPKAKENAKNNGLLSTLDDVKEHVLEKPRQVKLDKGDDGYGFYLKLQKLQAPLHVVTDITEDSPAAREGLQEGEVVGRVGNNDVMNMGHEECVQKIKEAGNSVELTVGSAKTFEVLYDLKVPVNDDLLTNWPDKDMLTAPDLSEHNGFFKLVALSKATDAVTETVAEKVVEKVVEKKTSEDESLVLCNLTKINGAFGFFLRDNAGHFLGTIEEGGSADVAGVKDNDEIVEVNGVNVEKVSHDEVVNRIGSSGDEVSFLVRRKPTDQSKTKEVEASAVAEQQVEEKKDPLPRFCKLNRLSTGYGFHLNSTTEGDRQGEYLTKIASDGAASIAGVLEGDRVIEVNGESIGNKTHDEVVGLIRQYPDKVTVLVVDEETDRFYKEKGVAITKALLVAAVISERKEDSGSHTSSTIEAEATVHVDADQVSEKDKDATIEFPPPPADEDKTADDEEKEEQILDELREIAEEIKEVAEEEMANDNADTVAEKIADKIADDVAEEIAENVADKIADDVTEEIAENVADKIADDVAEEIAENIAEKIADDVAEEIADNVAEAIAEKITEDLPENLSEEVREEIQENIADEIREDIKEEIEDDVKEAVVESIEDDVKEAVVESIKDDVKEAVVESIEDDVREAVHEEIKEEVLDVVEDEVRDNLQAAAAVVVANEILEAAKEESEAEEEEAKETMEEYKARLEREMREQIEREMKQKLEDEIKERMENEMKSKMAAEAPTPVPEPPSVVGVAAMAKAINQNFKPKSPVKKAAPFKFVPKADTSFKIEDITAASKRLKSIKKVNEVQNKIDENNPDEEETQFKPSFMSAKSMFEGGMKQQPTKQRPAWQQSRNTPVKQDPPKSTINPTPAQAKPQTGLKNPWKTSGMSFKIVETSSGFN